MQIVDGKCGMGLTGGGFTNHTGTEAKVMVRITAKSVGMNFTMIGNEPSVSSVSSP